MSVDLIGCFIMRTSREDHSLSCRGCETGDLGHGPEEFAIRFAELGGIKQRGEWAEDRPLVILAYESAHQKLVRAKRVNLFFYL